MNKEKNLQEQTNPTLNIANVGGSLLSFVEIMNEAKRVKENVRKLPFHDVSFQFGAEWLRDSLIAEIRRRQQMIISEPDGIIRETMIANLLVGLQ